MTTDQSPELSTSSEGFPPPPHPSAPVSPMRRLESELVVGGAVDEHEQPANGTSGVLAMAAIGALFIWLATISVWYALFAAAVLIEIVLHEAGHYMTARWTGMKATQFFIGFGPRLWSVRRGETEFGVRALPLGAFVRIIGMTKDEEVPAEDEQRTYRAKSYPRRMLVITAGSAMHLLIAIGLLFGVYVADGEPMTAPGARVAAVSERTPTPVSGGAAAAGVQAGDVIVGVGDETIRTDRQLGPAVRSHAAGETVKFTVIRGAVTAERGGTQVELPVTLGRSFDKNASIVGVQGIDVDGEQRLQQVLGKFAPGEVVAVRLARPGTGEASSRQPAVVAEHPDGSRSLEPTPLAGVTTGPASYVQRHTVASAAYNAVVDIFPASWTMAKGAVAVFNPANIWGHLNGTNDDLASRPTTMVGVGAVSADVGDEQGLAGFAFLLAMLSVFIGVFNMVPLLPLDGGHAAIATYERVREAISRTGQRYYADVNKLMPLTLAVVALLGMVLFAGLYLDITKPL